LAKQGFFQPTFFPIDKNDCTCTTGKNCLAEMAGVWIKVGEMVEDGATDDDDDTETSTTTVPNTCSNNNSNQNSANEIQSTGLDCNLDDDDDDLPNPLCAIYCNRLLATTTTAAAGPVDLTTTTTTVDQQNEAATTSTLESGELSSTSNNETHTGDGNRTVTNIRDIFDDETSSDEESAARSPSQHQQSRNK
jgi:hypothetical protein